ncbi:MAG TPA: MgtC/SapB family protein [Thermoanaerobaculia bacterium]|nr:MgtC/SapB family protein [Thermoanaerobaculia bacterium]
MPGVPLPETALRFAVAALGGLAVGIERQWSFKRSERKPRLAGVRTFLLLGLLGAIAAQLHATGFSGAALALALGTAALVAVSYAVSSRDGDVDATTEVAALLVFGAGALAVFGPVAIASGVSVLTVFVLLEKGRIHELVYSLRTQELSAGARFAVLAVVVLPLLPVGPFGPDPGIRPREIWSLVLLFSGLSFASFIALRVAGPARGYGVAGLLGGLVSSTAVTLNFARESAASPQLGRMLGLGVLAASTIVYVRVLVVTTVLNAPLARGALPLLAPPLLVGLGALLVSYRSLGAEAVKAAEPRNPLRLTSAIAMALAFQAVLYLIAWVRPTFGARGVLLSSALVGLTDVDALTFSMATLGRDPSALPVAAQSLGVGALANTLFKLGLALSLGRGTFRIAAGLGLLVLALGGAAALAMLRLS